ncbi:MAG TPA: hypothetical protein VM536_12745, partial [Chloroflexia bacterium]|nr:hypothetical protein [Chloroflexia bacterium]
MSEEPVPRALWALAAVLVLLLLGIAACGDSPPTPTEVLPTATATVPPTETLPPPTPMPTATVVALVPGSPTEEQMSASAQLFATATARAAARNTAIALTPEQPTVEPTLADQEIPPTAVPPSATTRPQAPTLVPRQATAVAVAIPRPRVPQPVPTCVAADEQTYVALMTAQLDLIEVTRAGLLDAIATADQCYAASGNPSPQAECVTRFGPAYRKAACATPPAAPPRFGPVDAAYKSALRHYCRSALDPSGSFISRFDFVSSEIRAGNADMQTVQRQVATL